MKTTELKAVGAGDVQAIFSSKRAGQRGRALLDPKGPTAQIQGIYLKIEITIPTIAYVSKYLDLLDK